MPFTGRQVKAPAETQASPSARRWIPHDKKFSGFAIMQTVHTVLQRASRMFDSNRLQPFLRVDRWTVGGFRDALFVRPRAREPRLFRDLDLAKRRIGRLPMRGAELQVRDIRDPALVLVAPEQVDVVVAHVSQRELSRIVPPIQAIDEPDRT